METEVASESKVKVKIKYLFLLFLGLQGCSIISDAYKRKSQSSDEGLNHEQQTQASLLKSEALQAEKIKWRKNGFTDEDIDHLRLYGVTLDDAVSCRATGYSVEQCASWKSLDIKNIEASEWVKNGFDPLNTGDNIKGWKKAGLSPSEASAWKMNGFTSDEATKFIRSGHDIKYALRRKEYVSKSCKNGIEQSGEWMADNPYSLIGRCVMVYDMAAVKRLSSNMAAYTYLAAPEAILLVVNFRDSQAPSMLRNVLLLGPPSEYKNMLGSQRYAILATPLFYKGWEDVSVSR